MSKWLALGVWVASLVMIGVGLTLIALVPAQRAPRGATLGDMLSLLPLVFSAASIGALIGWQRPGNRIGRLIALLGLIGGVETLLAGYAIFGLFGPHSLPEANVAAWAVSWLGASLGLCAYEIVFAYPDGPLDLRRTRIGRACGVLSTIVFCLGTAILPGELFNMPVQNPFGWAGAEAAIVALLAVAGILFVSTISLAASSLWERYRWAERRERLQIKWFLAALCFAAVVSLGAPALALVDFGLAKTAITLAVAAIPVAVAVAILRHHLYDIDVLINRALVYGATTVGIAIAFFGGIVVLQAILRSFTNGSELAVAAATLVSFAVFQPLRQRIQGAVDRRFYRSRYDAARILDAFSARLRDEVDLDAVRADLVTAVHETMQPAQASVWIRP